MYSRAVPKKRAGYDGVHMSFEADGIRLIDKVLKNSERISKTTDVSGRKSSRIIICIPIGVLQERQ